LSERERERERESQGVREGGRELAMSLVAVEAQLLVMLKAKMIGNEG
jgi:hypothetical protein